MYRERIKLVKIDRGINETPLFVIDNRAKISSIFT